MKKVKGQAVTDGQKADNWEKSRVRARQGHVFGLVENSMNGPIVRTIRIVRTKAKTGMMNLTYNLLTFSPKYTASLLASHLQFSHSFC
jgi:hypothetical protein